MAQDPVTAPPASGLAPYDFAKPVLAGEITEVVAAGCYVRNTDGTTALRPFAPEMKDRFQPKAGDFWVVVPGGYQILVPKDAFNESFKPAG